MKIKKYELLIVSSPEREKVYCEIYYEGQIIGEISQETEDLLLEIYPFSMGNMMRIFSLKEFQEILEKAKNHLLRISQ